MAVLFLLKCNKDVRKIKCLHFLNINLSAQNTAMRSACFAKPCEQSQRSKAWFAMPQQEKAHEKEQYLKEK